MPIYIRKLILFTQITNEMKTNEALAAYESEYVRLYESLYKAHRIEKELSEQCTSLKVNIRDKMQPSRVTKSFVDIKERNDFGKFNLDTAERETERRGKRKNGLKFFFLEEAGRNLTKSGVCVA